VVGMQDDARVVVMVWCCGLFPPCGALLAVLNELLA
jgi:hypothetical protein